MKLPFLVAMTLGAAALPSSASAWSWPARARDRAAAAQQLFERGNLGVELFEPELRADTRELFHPIRR